MTRADVSDPVLSVLRTNGLRNLLEVDIRPSPRVNAFVGNNGAGKTSVLESLYCATRGRSFRAGQARDWLNREHPCLETFLEYGERRIGVRQELKSWAARIDGVVVHRRLDVLKSLPLCVFHPESYLLIQGGPEERRRFLDYGLFHVEHGFMPAWQRYRRSLSQRNAALRSHGSVSELRSWHGELLASGEQLTAHRLTYVEKIQRGVATISKDLGWSLPEISLDYLTGWGEGREFEQALEANIAVDRERGFTSVGPHRADLRISDSLGRVAPRWSRGQQKILSLVLILAQGLGWAEPPLLALDDVFSELDRDRADQLIRWLEHGTGWQFLLTMTELPRKLSSAAVFHVEHGRVVER